MTMWDEIPDVGVLVPTGTYLVDIEDVEKGQSREHSKLMYSPVLRVVEPESQIDSPLYDNFVIGSGEDPGAVLVDTWKASFGARRFKQLVKAAQVEVGLLESYVDAAPEDQADQTIEVIKGQQVIVSVSIEKQAEKNPDGTPNRYAGREQNRITGYYPLGMKELGVVAEQPQAATSRPMPRPTASKPAAPARRLGPQPKPQAASPAPLPRHQVPLKLGGPPLRPGPKPLTKATPTPPPSPPARPGRPAAKAQMLVCEECVRAGGDKTQSYEAEVDYPNGALVSRADFPAHIESHGEE